MRVCVWCVVCVCVVCGVCVCVCVCVWCVCGVCVCVCVCVLCCVVLCCVCVVLCVCVCVRECVCASASERKEWKSSTGGSADRSSGCRWPGEAGERRSCSGRTVPGRAREGKKGREGRRGREGGRGRGDSPKSARIRWKVSFIAPGACQQSPLSPNRDLAACGRPSRSGRQRWLCPGWPWAPRPILRPRRLRTHGRERHRA